MKGIIFSVPHVNINRVKFKISQIFIAVVVNLIKAPWSFKVKIIH